MRGAIDLYLEIGDTADIGGGESFIVDEIIYQKDVIQSLLNWTQVIRTSSIVLITLFHPVFFPVQSQRSVLDQK